MVQFKIPMFDMKHLKKVEGYIGGKIVRITMKIMVRIF